MIKVNLFKKIGKKILSLIKFIFNKFFLGIKYYICILKKGFNRIRERLI